MLGFHALGQQALGATVATDDLAVIADAGVFALTGQAANLLFHRRLSADVGTFAVSGGVVADSVITAKRLQVFTGGGVRGLRASSGGGGKGLRIRA